MNRRDRLATSDFTLAAVLLVRGFGLIGIQPDPSDPRHRQRFLLTGDAVTLAELSRALLIDDVLVPARAFALAQRRLKRVLYDGGPAPNPRSDAQEGRPT